MTFILVSMVCGMAFAAWVALRLVRGRGSASRRRVRRTQGSARQKAWEMVFGRRMQRLSFDPATPPTAKPDMAEPRTD